MKTLGRVCVAFSLCLGCLSTAWIAFSETPSESVSSDDSGYSALEPLATYAVEQEGLLAEFQETSISAHRDRDAYLLSELWKAGMLRPEIKEALVRSDYPLVLLQVYGNYQAPNFVLRCHQTFPFPSVWAEFTPTLYINGEVVWAPTTPETSHALSVNNSTITSRIGGVVKNGDVLQYQVKIRVTAKGEDPWETMVWSNKVVARGLKQ